MTREGDGTIGSSLSLEETLAQPAGNSENRPGGDAQVLEKILDQAVALAAHGRYEDAAETVEDALRLDPENATAQNLFRSYRRLSSDDASRTETRRAIAEAAAAIEELIEADQLNEALSGVEAMEERFGAAAPSEELRGRIVELQTPPVDERLSAGVEQINELLQGDQVDEAAESLAALESAFAGDPALVDLHRRVEEARSIEEDHQRQDSVLIATAAIEAQIENGFVDEALKATERLREDYGSRAPYEELKARIEAVSSDLEPSAKRKPVAAILAIVAVVALLLVGGGFFWLVRQGGAQGLTPTETTQAPQPRAASSRAAAVAATEPAVEATAPDTPAEDATPLTEAPVPDQAAEARDIVEESAPLLPLPEVEEAAPSATLRAAPEASAATVADSINPEIEPVAPAEPETDSAPPIAEVSPAVVAPIEIDEAQASPAVTAETGVASAETDNENSTGSEPGVGQIADTADTAADEPTVPFILGCGQGGLVCARAIRVPQPDYPAEADDRLLSGTVTVSVLIDETGKVAEAEVEKASDPVFEKAALEATYNSDFQPATRDGVPGRSWAQLSFEFSPPGGS